MYVPTGFPHTTDTSTVIHHETVPARPTMAPSDDGDEGSVQNLFDETSIHLTMGIDTHVWALAYAHLRWALLQKVGKEFRMEMDDYNYWNAMDTIPVGFLAGSEWNGSDDEAGLDDERIKVTVDRLKEVMIQLEPDRWGKKENMPADKEFTEVARFMLKHVHTLLRIQHEQYSNIKPQSDETIMKAFEANKATEEAMARFTAFCRNEIQAS